MYIYHVLIIFSFHSSSKLLLDLCLSKLHILSVFYKQSLIYAAHIVMSVEPSTGSQLTHQGHKLKENHFGIIYFRSRFYVHENLIGTLMKA